MQNQINSITSIDRDTRQINIDLNQLYNVSDAIKVLSSTDPETTDIYNLTLHGAIQVLADIDHAHMVGNTLDEFSDYIDGRIADLRDERQAFRKARKRLLEENCENLLPWINRELAELKAKVSRSTDKLSNGPMEVRIQTLKDVLERFSDGNNKD